MTSLGTNSSYPYAGLYTPLWDPFYSPRIAEIGMGVCCPHLRHTIPKIFSSLLLATLKSLYLQEPHTRYCLQPQNSYFLPNSRNTGPVFAETLSPHFTVSVATEKPEFQWERRCSSPSRKPLSVSTRQFLRATHSFGFEWSGTQTPSPAEREGRYLSLLTLIITNTTFPIMPWSLLLSLLPGPLLGRVQGKIFERKCIFRVCFFSLSS